MYIGPGVKRALLLFTLLTIFTVPMLAQNNSIDTISQWNGTTSISMFGSGTSGTNSGTSTYGQSITIGANANPLNSYSFEMNCTAGTVTLRGEVYAWDGTKASGAALFEGSPQTVTGGGGFQVVTVNVGGLTLPAGSYVLFVTTTKDMTTPGPGCTFGILPTNSAILGGMFVYLNDYNSALWTTATWGAINQDLAMRVNGLVTPLPGVPASSPASLTIGVILLIGLGVFFLSRRQRVTT